MEKRYYQKEIETMPLDELKALQKEKLLKQVRHVYDNVPYYRAKMDELGVTPDDIKELEDLAKLPFLSKADLRDAYPYGLLAVPLSDCVRIQSTSGTTGKRVVAFYTQNDIELWEDCCARAIMAAGGTNEDVCQVAVGLHVALLDGFLDDLLSVTGIVLNEAGNIGAVDLAQNIGLYLGNDHFNVFLQQGVAIVGTDFGEGIYVIL